jgi:WD40 repeat protein
MAELPIIVLAFANDQEGRRYLRDLPEELRRLQGILKDVERNGLCRLELLPNATLDQIFDVFTRHRDQVTVLHYAGHADSGRLLLESNVAGGAPANASGLATFLGQRRGLQLVFLNGCSTRAQAARFLDAGVASVITTARTIDDTVARDFAAAFYTELAAGLPLRAAFESSRGRVLAARGDAPHVYYQTRDLGDTETDSASPDPSDDHGFPWEFRPGTELVERWSLPDAAGNPEFGLPHLPERDLPECPFRHLVWFTAEHAEVFFGRGYQVRELYEQVSDPSGPPILLLYGASGVGKSSLLDAGLVPRLEAGGAVVRYYRREQNKGLAESLRDALQRAGEQTALGEGWRAEEVRLEKPLVIFLDQVEEVFTRPDPARPRELDEFLLALGSALGNRDARPRGKLVLGFRKEWLAEIDRRLAEAKLPRSKVFLKPLDRRGIMEAIRGPARPGRLLRQYRLTIEEGLPEAIAEDLIADAGSALAPTLQVLLTKMWERARQANPDQPRFDRVLYETLKSQGYLLKDVLDEGLKAIAAWNPAVEESGLALDVLVYHTTDLGTASQCTRATLNARYHHQADALEGLLGYCKDCYLIAEAEPRPDSPDRSTRLAHDLLAPLVQQRFRISIAPGQRARRLLENRAPEWQEGKIGPVLDSPDLATVEEGAPGMRAWTADENRLVEASRRAREQKESEERERASRIDAAEARQRQAELEKQRETERRLRDQEASNLRLRKRGVALVSMLLASIGAALAAAYQWRAADTARHASDIAKGIANEKTEEANKSARKEAVAAEIAKNQTRLAENRLRAATSRHLAALSWAERNNRLDRSLLLAVAACQAGITFEARDSLLRALEDRPGLTSFFHSSAGNVGPVALSPDGKTLAAICDGRVPCLVLWDTGSGERLAGDQLLVKEGRVLSLVFSPDGKTLAAGYTDAAKPRSGVVLWDAERRTRLFEDPLVMKQGQVLSIAFSPDGKTVATGLSRSDGHGVALWEIANRRQLAESPDRVNGEGFWSIAINVDGKTVAARYEDEDGKSGVLLWDAAGNKRLADDPLPVKEGKVWRVAFSPDGKTLAAGYSDDDHGAGVVLWDAASRKRLAEGVIPVKEGSVLGLAFSPDGKTVLAGYGRADRYGLLLWDMASRKRQTRGPFTVKEADFSDLAFTSNGATIAVAYSLLSGPGDGAAGVTLWNTARGKQLVAGQLSLKEGRVEDVAYSPDGKTIAGACRTGVALWDASSGERLGEGVMPAKEGTVRSVAFSPDGKTIAGACGTGVALWDASSRKRLGEGVVPAKEGTVRSMAFSPDGKTIAGAYGTCVVLWDTASQRRLTDDQLAVKGGMLECVAFSADGKTLATGYRNASSVVGGVLLWDAASYKRLLDDPLPVKEGTVRSLAFSPDGKTLAAVYTGRQGAGVVLWDSASRKQLSADLLPVKEGSAMSMAFSPDTKTLAARYSRGVRKGGFVVLWDTASRELLAGLPLLVEQGDVSSAAISPDGKTVAAGYTAVGGMGGGVALLDVDLHSWQGVAGKMANRNFTLDEWRQYFPDEPYRRTFRNLSWPANLPEADRMLAEQIEKELQSPKGASMQ